MASNHTTNYQLCQWQADDQVKRTDFNEDNAKIDAALNDLSDGLAAAREEKADQSALDALAAEVAKKATTAALEAVRAAVPKIAVGTYTGTGKYGASNPIRLNFSGPLSRAPQLLVIKRNEDQDGAINRGLIMVHGAKSVSCFLCRDISSQIQNTVTWNAYTVSWYADNAASQMNESGIVYRYFAIG